jgi:hypothetical protein
MLRVGVVERITNIGYTIGTIRDVKRSVALLQVFWEWLGTCRRCRALRLIWVKFQDVLPFHFDAVTRYG